MASKRPRIELWKVDSSPPWHWKAVHRNGSIVCVCINGYKTKQAALKAIRMVQEMIRRGDIEEAENRAGE